MGGQIQQGMVSTIIPVFNRADMVGDSINSVLQQDYRPIEIIVVDDGSTDKTPSVLEKLAAQHKEIKLLRQANAGPGAARELARCQARGEFIQYHDSDDLLLPGKFTAQVKALRNNPQCDVAFGKTEHLEIGEEPRGVPLKGSGSARPAMFPDSLRSRWWSTSTPLYRRSVTDMAGAWLSTCCEEDWEYECRVAALGGCLVFVDQFVSITQAHSDGLSQRGTTDPAKLKDRCVARAAIYQHALNYSKLADRVSEFSDEDWLFFSKSTFLLARECAAAGLTEESRAMIALSIEANGGPNLQHRVFSVVAALLGWRGAATAVKLFGR